MRLLNLHVENFGLYRGSHDFDLALRPTQPSRNLLLFKGHNGAGKSTLFQAVPLALHGPLTLGGRLARPQYEAYLLRMLHRQSPNECAVAAVRVDFEYVRSGITNRIRVERRWQRSGKKVLETLTAIENGESLRLNSEDCQSWLNELIPPGISLLCFFDAERLEEFSNPEHHNQRLGETVRRLLGFDLVERLQTDLDQFTLQQGGSKKTERFRSEVVKLQQAVEQLETQMAGLQEKAAVLEAEQTKVATALVIQKEKLQAAGGGFAARKETLNGRLAQVEKHISEIHQEIHELCAGLGVFSIARQLLHHLSESLQHEALAQQRQAAGDVWKSQLAALKQEFLSAELWKDIKGVKPAQQEKITAAFLALLEKNTAFGASEAQTLLHNLSEPDNRQLQDWIQQALSVLPAQTQALQARLKGLRQEEKEIKADLQRVPDEFALVPIHQEIQRLEGLLADGSRRKNLLTEEIGSLRFRLDEQNRKRQKASEQLFELQAGEHRLGMAERTKQVLKTYQDALTRERLTALETALLEKFNLLCRKEALLTKVAIDPATFAVSLQTGAATQMGLEELSAGERQLYALALFWALRQVSRHDLPLLIDTPLARLDETHRNRVIQDYFTKVSRQVVLFVTDAEMDQQSAGLLERRAARGYRLSFDPQAQETTVALLGKPNGKAAVNVT